MLDKIEDEIGKGLEFVERNVPDHGQCDCNIARASAVGAFMSILLKFRNPEWRLSLSRGEKSE